MPATLPSRRAAAVAAEWSFLALVAMLPIVQPLQLYAFGYVIPPADLVFLIAAPLFAVSLATGACRFRWSPVFLPLALYALAMALSAIASEDVRRSTIKLAGEWYLIGLAVLTVNHANSVASCRRIVRAWLAGTTICVLASLAGLGLFLAGATDQAANIFLDSHGSLPPGTYPRVMGSFLNSNMLCTYLAASLLLLEGAAALQWIAATPARLLRIGAAVATALSLSPGLGGVALAWGLWHARRLRPRAPRLAAVVRSFAWAAAVVFLIATLVSPASRPSVAHRPFLAGVAPSSRVLVWAQAWRTFLAQPWLGRGVGLDAADLRELNASGVTEHLTDAHNAWLSILAQEGAAGGAAFLLVVVTLLRGAVAPLADPDRRVLRDAVLLAFVGGFLYQTATGSFEDARHVWVVIGLLAAVSTDFPLPAR